MNFFSPNDNPVSEGGAAESADRNFGGNRETTTGAQRRSQDYTKPTESTADMETNPVDETVRDVDEMTEEKARKREFTRRAETNDHSDHNKERFHESEPANRPPEETDATQKPDSTHRRSKLKGHFGEGQYDNYPNRGYEGEIS